MQTNNRRSRALHRHPSVIVQQRPMTVLPPATLRSCLHKRLVVLSRTLAPFWPCTNYRNGPTRLPSRYPNECSPCARRGLSAHLPRGIGQTGQAVRMLLHGLFGLNHWHEGSGTNLRRAVLSASAPAVSSAIARWPTPRCCARLSQRANRCR